MKKNAILSFLLVFGILTILFVANGFAPFGSSSLASNDARIQYIDFFLYLKDVLAGKNSVSYTFSKLLGGSAIALFSYYLASPLNLFVAFFPETQILSFIDLLILLKASLAATAFSLFLSQRFPNLTSNHKPRVYSVFLSAGYGLSQYVLTQCANLMWLDGVILLPFMMLGVYKVVNGRGLWHLALPTACSVLFNWYTAGMNCLFAAVWLLLELALFAAEPGTTLTAKHILRILLRWLAAMLVGLLCSAVLFLPTIMAMVGSRKGNLNYWSVLLPIFRAPLYVILESSVYGARTTNTSISLFSGVLPILGVTSLFFQKENPFRKLIFAIFLLLLTLMFCWFPLYSLFNLLELPQGHFGRFTYLQIFGVLFVAAWALFKDQGQKPHYIPAAVVYTAVLILIWYLRPYEEKFPVFLTAGAVLLFSIMLVILNKMPVGSKKGKFCTALIILMLVTDLTYHSQLQLTNTGTYPPAGVETPAYIAQQQKLIQALKTYDSGSYRISQTRNRWTDPGRWTANYDEPFGYNYWSISEYSSTAPASQLNFMEHAGYRTEADVMTIVNTSILGTDSLLGVRYILSDIPINGLVPIPELPGFDGKTAYKNPYALPLAFRYTPGSSSTKQNISENPFEYQNQLFSYLLGEDVALYKPIEYECSSNPEESTRTYRLSLPEGNIAVYGNIPWTASGGMSRLDLNGKDESVYAGWLAPSVFYIPVEPSDQHATVTLSGNATLEDSEQFYALDLDLLQEVTDRLKATAIIDAMIQNGSITVRTKAKAGEMLFLSVPADKGWQIILNGEKTEPQLFADLFCKFPLQEGENTLTMQYRIPYLNEGILFSLLGLTLLFASILTSKERRI